MIEALPGAQGPPPGHRCGGLGHVPFFRAPRDAGLAGHRSEWVLSSPGYTADPRGGGGRLHCSGWNLNQGQIEVEKVDAFHLYALIKNG